MANTFKENSVILDHFMARFQNKTKFTLTANRNFTEDYKSKPMRKGATLQYRLPYGYDVGHTLTVTPQNSDDRTRSLTVDKISNIALRFNGMETTLQDAMKDPFAKQYMLSQVDAIANDVELTIGTNFYKSSYHTIGTPGAALTVSTIGDARAKMLKLGILFGELYGALNPDASNALANSQNTQFNKEINSAALKDGYLGELKGFEFFETVHLPRHIAGVGVGGSPSSGKKAAGAVNGQVTSGTTVNIDGLLAAQTKAFADGDIIFFAGVYSVNPLTKEPTDMLQEFVVVGDTPSDPGGNASVTVSPAIIVSGPYQNVSGPIPDNAVVTMYDSHNVSLFYSKEALYYAAPQLIPLKNGVTSGVSYDDTYRMAFTYNEGSDVVNYEEIQRLDHLHGEAYNGEFVIRGIS